MTEQPAQPILASALLSLEQRQRARFSSAGESISTACAQVDGVLGGGGVERGVVVGVSAEGAREGRLISLHLIASVLLAQLPKSLGDKARVKAAVIDTTGSFPLALLAKVLRSRVEGERPHAHSELRDDVEQAGDAAAERKVERCLEMVSISRVFDAEGLWEVFSELIRDSQSSLGKHDREEASGVSVAAEHVKTTGGAEINSRPAAVIEIGDSEEEDSSSDGDHAPKQSMAQAERPNTQARTEEQSDDGIEIIIVDNMTQIINELLARREKGEAHDLLTTLSNTIHALSSQSNILTILHNSTVSSKSTYPSTRREPQPQSKALSSVFASNPVKPALGKIFDQFPSLHLMLSPMPKRREDAEVLYCQDGDSPSPSHVEYCIILEVLKDETPNLGEGRSRHAFGRREQRWAGVVVGDEGVCLRGAFGSV